MAVIAAHGKCRMFTETATSLQRLIAPYPLAIA